jgi:hypothetical protein
LKKWHLASCNLVCFSFTRYCLKNYSLHLKTNYVMQVTFYIISKTKSIKNNLFFTGLSLFFIQWLKILNIIISALRVLAWRWEGLVFFRCSWVRVLMCTPVTPAVPYMPTGFAGCSVDRGISRGARKLARTPT